MTEKLPVLNLTKMEVAHGAVRLAASVSVKMIIGTAIAQIVPTETKADKAKVIVGSYVLSGIVADHAKTFASDKLTETVEAINSLKSKIAGN